MAFFWEPVIVFKMLLFRCEGTYKLAHANCVQIYLAFLIYIHTYNLNKNIL